MGEAACAVHQLLPASGTCARCGRFVCAACGEATPCLECQILASGAAQPMPPYLPVALRWLFIVFVASDCFDALTYRAQQDMLRASAFVFVSAFLNSGVMLLVWLALICFFLVWYLYVLRWAISRGAPVRASTAWLAIAWFVPGVNLVQPYLTLRTALRTTGVRAPLGLWWSAWLASLAVLVARLVTGLTVATAWLEAALEVSAAVLGLLVVSRVSAAIGAESPVEARARREAALKAQ